MNSFILENDCRQVSSPFTSHCLYYIYRDSLNYYSLLVDETRVIMSV